ncbi:MAG: helix-turn-helix domain-containing protein [Saprospiraceae bacterium]|nr:helix-turn-helix domain-containing protein [Saprospiraceae bacterium]
MEVSTQIKLLRENKNISREQMADWLSMSVNTYKKIEYGERMPALDELKIIADKLEVNPAIFFKKEGTTVINHGDYSTGVGNVIINDKDLILALNTSINKLAFVLDRMSQK